MKMNYCLNGQEFYTRVLQFLTVLVTLENVALGFRSKMWESKLLFPQDRSHRSMKRTPVHHSAMMKVKKTYSAFYDDWKIFSESVPNKLNPKTPCVLWSNVEAISDIIKPSDHAFGSLDDEGVIKRISLTLGTANAYLKTLDYCRFIRRNPESQRFFTLHKNRLDFLATLVKFSLLNVRYDSVHYDSGPHHLGLGQVNPGVYRAVGRETLKKLRDLLIGLKSSKC